MSTIHKESDIAEIFRCVRKFQLMRQTEFSMVLGVTQGTISKIESKTMSPDLTIWFKLLKTFFIKDPYCFSYSGCEIEDAVLLQKLEEGSSLFRRLVGKDNYIAQVKSIRPLIDFLRENYSEKYDEFLKKQQIDDDGFYILNHPLGIKFLLTFFKFISDLKITSKVIYSLNMKAQHAYQREITEKRIDGISDIINMLHQSRSTVFTYTNVTTNEFRMKVVKIDPNLLPGIIENELLVHYHIALPFFLLKNYSALKGITIESSKPGEWSIKY